MERKIRVLFICHGNICRSPMFEFILKDMVEKRGIKDRFEIASAATSCEELGNHVYPSTQEQLAMHNIGKTPYTSYRNKVATLMTRGDYDYYDYLICADRNNIRNAKRIIGTDKDKKLSLLLDFTDNPGRDVSDPWYSGEFDKTYKDAVEGCNAFLQVLQNEGKI